MKLAWSDDDARFADEVRAFLDESLTPELRSAGSRMTSVYADYETGMAWPKILQRKGRGAPAS